MQLLVPSTSRTYTPLSDEARLSHDPQPDNVPSRQSTPSELDLGEVRRGPSRKGKEKAWDEEMGPVEVVDSYPPVNQDDQEERRVQDVSLQLGCADQNLAKFAARDAARRRAARLSRQVSTESSTSTRRPFSMMSYLSKTSEPANQPATNPPQRTSPMVTPTSPKKSPFADPQHARHESTSTAPGSPSYGYAGAEWRGGANAAPRPEKWWHALCSWGSDLDGGHDDVNEGRNQAGRTNPFE